MSKEERHFFVRMTTITERIRCPWSSFQHSTPCTPPRELVKTRLKPATARAVPSARAELRAPRASYAIRKARYI